jgi:clan AA aspartic protease
MQGIVANGIEAIISLRLIGRQGQIEDIPAVVDTGFTSELTLSPSAIRDLDYIHLTTSRVTLADGSTTEASVYRGFIDWFGKKGTILVLETDSEALLGMELMQNCRLTMDVVPDGPFSIAPFESTQE